MLVHRGFPVEFERYRSLVEDDGRTICVAEGSAHFIDGVQYKWRRGRLVAEGRRLLVVDHARVITDGVQTVAAGHAHITARACRVELFDAAHAKALTGSIITARSSSTFEVSSNAHVHVYDDARPKGRITGRAALFIYSGASWEPDPDELGADVTIRDYRKRFAALGRVRRGPVKLSTATPLPAFTRRLLASAS